MDKLCKYLDRELEEYENKVANGGKLSRTEIEDGKNLAKFKMALLTNDRMEKEGYSSRYPDSYGRYSRDDAREAFREEAERLIHKAPDDHTRKKLERILNEM